MAVRGQLTPLTQDLLTKISQEAEQLKVRLQQDLSSVKSQLEPYVQEVMSELQQQVEQSIFLHVLKETIKIICRLFNYINDSHYC